jgi:hypothetical protein
MTLMDIVLRLLRLADRWAPRKRSIPRYTDNHWNGVQAAPEKRRPPESAGEAWRFHNEQY